MLIMKPAALAVGLAIAAATSPSFAQENTAREQAIQNCAAGTYVTWNDWEIQTYRSCMARQGQPE
jgi:hypothetical protein